MPTVEYVTGWADERDSGVEGERRQVSGPLAQQQVQAGYARLVRDEPPSTPEVAAARPGLEEPTVARRRTRGGRGSG